MFKISFSLTFHFVFGEHGVFTGICVELSCRFQRFQAKTAQKTAWEIQKLVQTFAGRFLGGFLAPGTYLRTLAAVAGRQDGI